MSQLTVLSDEIVSKHKNPCSSSPRAWTLMYHPLPPQCFWMCSFCQSRCSVASWRWQEEAVISKVDQGGCLVWHSPEAQPVPGYPTYTLPLLLVGPLFSSLSLPTSVHSYFQTTVFIFTAFSCFQKIPWPAQSTSLSPLFSILLS